MDNLKNIVITLIVAVVVASGVVAFSPRETVVNNVGAVSSPDIMSPYIKFGGVRQEAGYTSSLVSASTTVCAIQSPSSTSTLLAAGVRFLVASSSAIVVDIAKSTSPAATTTKLGATTAVGAGAQATIVASTTGAVGGDAYTFSPSTWFVVKMDNGSGVAGNAPTGSCSALWMVI